MVKYLNIDGLDDGLTTPSVTITKVLIDMVHETDTTSVQAYLLDTRTTDTKYAYVNSGGRITGGNLLTAKVDGVNSVPLGQRCIIDISVTSISISAPLRFFSRYLNDRYSKGKVYRITGYNGAAVAFDYDMSTGTVQDQSGNGNHATLNGGTWLDDGAGGTPTGTDGTTAFDVKQSIYSDSSVNTDTKLSLYSDSLTVTDTKQALYQDSSFAVDSKQTIYSDSVQAYDSKQILYSDSFTLFDTLQDLIDNTYGTTTFDVQVILYADSQTAYDTKQACYTEGSFQSDLLQILKEPTKPVISEIHLMGGLNAVTRFTVKNDAPINLRTKNTTSIHLKGGIQ